MKTYLIDTNFLLRYLLNDNPQQTINTEKYLKSAVEGNIILLVDQLILIEIVFALIKFYKWPKEKIINNLYKIISAPFLNIEKREIALLALDIFKNSNLGFIDSLLLARNKHENLTLLTYDKELLKQISN